MSNITASCLYLHIPPVVGPAEVYSSLGHWNTAVYVILVLHLVPVWVVSTLSLSTLSSSLPPNQLPPTAWLVSIPPAIMSATAAAIVVPSLGKYVEVLLEIIICIGLVKIIQLSVLLCGGHDNLVNICRKRNTKLPIGSPPFVCLLPFRKPKVSRMNLNLMIFAPALLLAVKIIILVIDLIFLCIGYIPSGDFIAYDNLHHIIAFPVGLFAIYCYTMFNFIMNDCLEGNSKRFLGIILLLEFILFDCLRLFFIFLTGISYYRITYICKNFLLPGTGMLTCVPPNLSQELVVHLLKNYIKAFLATGLGLPFIKLCSSKMDTGTLQSAASIISASMSSLVSDQSSKSSA